MTRAALLPEARTIYRINRHPTCKNALNVRNGSSRIYCNSPLVNWQSDVLMGDE